MKAIVLKEKIRLNSQKLYYSTSNVTDNTSFNSFESKIDYYFMA